MNVTPLVIEPLPGIGDLMWFLPHLRAIAANSVTQKICLLTKPNSKASELLMAEDIVADFIWLQRDRRASNQPTHQRTDEHLVSGGSNRHSGILGRWRLAQDLKNYHFQTAWILHHSPFYARVCQLAGVTQRIGYTSNRWFNSLTEPLLLQNEQQLSAREKSTTLLMHHGYDLKVFDAPLRVSHAANTAAQRRLNCLAGLPKIVIGIGASEVKKCWPVDKFILLIQWLLQLDCGVIVCGGPSERSKANYIMAQCDNHKNLINCTHQPLLETVALIKAVDYYVGNDTSLMNIAVNQRKPSFVFFGPTYTVYSDYIIPIIDTAGHVSAIDVETVQHLLKKYVFQKD